MTGPRRFEASETTTIRDLQSTVRKIGATSLRVSARDMLNPKDTQAEIVFDRAGTRYVVRCKKWADYLDNLRAAQRTIAFLHAALEEYGATSSQTTLDAAFRQLFGGFEATPDDTVLMLGSGANAWWEVLGVQPAATKAEVMNAYRSLAKVHHPDTGGNADMFKRLRRAYEDGLAAVGGSASPGGR